MVQNGNYVLHSVVDQQGDLYCVTPAPFESEDTFEFIADELIEWRDDGNVRTAYRLGIEIGTGLRSNPKKTIDESEQVIAKLTSGVHPLKAMRLINDPS